MPYAVMTSATQQHGPPCMKVVSPAVVIYYQKNSDVKNDQRADLALNVAYAQQEQVFTSR